MRALLRIFAVSQCTCAVLGQIPRAEDEVFVNSIIELDGSLSEVQKTVLTGMLETKRQMELTRSFNMFSKMAFWAIVTAVTFNTDHTFSVDVTAEEMTSISGLNLTEIAANGDINLDAATAWFDRTYTRHGCYCWPNGERNITGFGIPLDPLDHVCHQLYMCYKCLNLNPSCKAKQIDSQMWDYHCVLFASEDGNLELTCNDEDPCLRAACECDKAFSFDAIHATKDPQWANKFSTECFPGKHSRSNKACCGNWPYVRIYSQEIQCCGDDMKLHSWGQIESGGQCEAVGGDTPTLSTLMEDLDAEMELQQELAVIDPEVEVHDHSAHDGLSGAANMTHDEFHAANPDLAVMPDVHDTFHAMEQMHQDIHTMGGGDNPQLHDQFHNQAVGAMDTMGSMMDMNRAMQGSERGLEEQGMQQMMMMRQQLQQNMMQMQQMMASYNQMVGQNMAAMNAFQQSSQVPAYSAQAFQQPFSQMRAAPQPEAAPTAKPVPVYKTSKEDKIGSLWNQLHARK